MEKAELRRTERVKSELKGQLAFIEIIVDWLRWYAAKVERKIGRIEGR